MRTITVVALIIFSLFTLGDHMRMAPSIQKIKKQHEPKLLNLAGVVSVGIGMAQDGKKTIVVGLEGPNPKTEAQIPTTLSGFPVQIQFIGPIQAQ